MEEKESIAFSCWVKSTERKPDDAAPLGLRVRLDGNVIYENAHVKRSAYVEHTFPDSDAEHVIEFELFGKLPEHTKITEAGEIYKDAMVNISGISLDGIDVTKVVQETMVYKHDFNGTQPLTEAKFYGDMGCNGVASLKFTTPIYLWLLEHM